MATSLIKLRQLDQTELSGYVQGFLGGSYTSSGFSFTNNIIPASSGLYNIGNSGRYWNNIYTNQLNLPSGSGVYFGNQYFTTSGDSLLIIGPSGTTKISSTMDYVTIVGNKGDTGPTGATGAKITGVSQSSNNISFLLNDGSTTNSIALPSGASGVIGPTGLSGVSVTGAITGIDITGQYFKFLFSNASTGSNIYVPSGVQGPEGEVGGATLTFTNLTGVFSGQAFPKVNIGGFADLVTGSPMINLIKGFSYKFDYQNLGTLFYGVYPNQTGTNFVAYGRNNSGASLYTDGTLIYNSLGDTLLTGITSSGALLFTIFSANATGNRRYLYQEPSFVDVENLIVQPGDIFETYDYVAETITIASSGYNFYWKTKGTLKFGDLNQGSDYKYGFALYQPIPSDPPTLPETGARAYYVLGDLKLSYAPLAGPAGPQGVQGIPGAQGLIGLSGAAGPTGVGVSGVNTVITNGILSGFQLVLTNGQSAGPYMIPTGGPQGSAGAAGPIGPTGATGVSVTGVNQLTSATINFGLSNNTSTNTVTLPQGPKGDADLYYSYFDPIDLRVSGQISYPTGFQVSTNGSTWTNATGTLRNLSTGQYIKIFGSPTLPFAKRSYSNSQNLIFARRGATGEYFGAQVVSFDGTDLTAYVNPQVGYWTTNGLNILANNGTTVDLNLGQVTATGPTGVSITGISGYTAIVNGELGTTGIKFFLSDSTSSPVYPLAVGPRGFSGAAQIFKVSGLITNNTVNPNITGNFNSSDFIEYNITGDTTSITYTIDSGTVVTGQTCSVLLRNSGASPTSFAFNPTNQFYFVNNITPLFPQNVGSFNIYTFVRSMNYNNHPVYYCTYAANYPALS